MKTLYITISALTLMTAESTQLAQFTGPAEALPRIETFSQSDHARELFRRAGYSYLFTEYSHLDMRPFVMAAVEASLPTQFQSYAFEIARAVIEEGNQHHMDPFFLLAVIKTESKFNLNAIGTHGEIGVMQILPATAAQIAPQAGLPTNVDLRSPANNIRIGATYFAQLRQTFEHQPDRYVGAYNMGARHVRRLVASKAEPHIYPDKVLNHYKEFYHDIGRAVVIKTKGVTQTLALK